MSKEILASSLLELHRMVKAREVTSEEVCQAFLDRAGEVEGKIAAFLHLDPERVLEQAREIDRAVDQGKRSVELVTGIPVAIKDVIVTRDMPTTCGSRMLENYRPPYDATVVTRLRDQGAVLFGKTNCDEFAMGSSTENSAFRPTRNPWDRERVPGGSSGGSAACVSAGSAPVSLGTDTGGSIRQPAAFCGVVGLKPTYGRVSRRGLVAFASSLDQIGPFCRSVEDTAAFLGVIAAPDPRDSTCSTEPVDDYLAGLEAEPGGLRVGVAVEWIAALTDPEIRQAVETSVAVLEQAGCSLRDIRLDNDRRSIAVYYLVATAEASSNLARYDGIRYGHRSSRSDDLESLYRKSRSEGFGEEVQRRIMLGTFALSSGYYDAYYRKAGQIRRLIQEDYNRVFEQVDVILGPVTPTPPFRLGEKTQDPLQMYLSDVFTVSASLAGIPGLSLPAAFSGNGLPIGVQILAPAFQERRLLQVAHLLEKGLALEKPLLPL